MLGIDSKVIVHQLKMDPNYKVIRQNRRSFNPERYKMIEEEIAKLLKASFIKEAYYPTWLANIVIVKKSNGKWKNCIDFTDLNRAYPKDSFPLLRIDKLIDTIAGHELLIFMDAYFGYNQI